MNREKNKAKMNFWNKESEKKEKWQKKFTYQCLFVCFWELYCQKNETRWISNKTRKWNQHRTIFVYNQNHSIDDVCSLVYH